MTVGPWVDRSYVGLLVDDSRLIPGMRTAMDRAMGPLQQQADRAADGIIKSFDRVDDQARQVFDRVARAGRDATGELSGHFDRAAAAIDQTLDGVGDGAFAGLRSDARRAADGIEEEFEAAGRDADQALDRVDQPGRFRGVGNQAEREGDRVSRAFRSASVSSSASLGNLRVRAFGAGAVIAGALGTVATAAATMGIQAAASMEQAEISFTQLLGSGRRAKDFLADLNRFAATTPFELPGLIEASRSLLGAGQAAKDVIPIMTALGDATGALGLSQEAFGRIMLATTQAMNKGRLQGEELMQMQEAGLPVTAMLAKALGVTTKRVGELSQAGKLQSDEILPKLFDQMHKDYGGSMIKQSRTLNGLWSTFMDTTRNALREGFEPLVPVLKDILPEAAQILEGAIRSVVGFFRDDLGPELGRVRQAWDDNGTAILGMFTSMATGRGEMDQSKTAAQSLADTLVVLTNTLGDAARLGDQVAQALNGITDAATNEGGAASAIHDNFIDPLNTVIRKAGEWIGVNQVVGLIARDVRADLADLGVTFGHNSAATDDATSAAEDHAAALRAEKAAVDDLNDALKDEKNANINLRQAQLNVQVAEKRLTDLKRAGKQGSLEYRQAQLSLERAQLSLTTTTQDYRATVDKSRGAERLAASASDSLRAAQRRLDATTLAAGKQILLFGQRAQDAFAKLKSKTVRVKADYDTSTPRGFELLVEKGLVRKAGGGPVLGPGGPTDDLIPAAGPGGTGYRLSDQEHIVDAAAIRGLGRGDYGTGHQLLTALRGLWRGMATGGPVLSFAGMSNRPYLDRPPRFDRNIDKSIDASIAGFRQVLEDIVPVLTGGTGAGFGSGSWKRAIDELHRDDVPFQIISTYRPGARTHASGAVSYHALNRAVDLTGPNMLRIFNSLTDTSPTELIYAFADVYKSRSGWHPINQLDRVTWRDHTGHVHAAYDGGGYLRPGRTSAWNGSGSDERVLSPAETKVWEALEQRLATRTGPVAGPAQTVVNVAAGAVRVEVHGPVTDAQLPRVQASVEDGLYQVLREFRTGSRR